MRWPRGSESGRTFLFCNDDIIVYFERLCGREWGQTHLCWRVIYIKLNYTLCSGAIVATVNDNEGRASLLVIHWSHCFVDCFNFAPDFVSCATSRQRGVRKRGESFFIVGM